MKPTDNELFLQFIDRLLEKKVNVKDIVDEDTLKELKTSLVYRGISLEEDCKKFIEAIDQSIAEKFIFPKEKEKEGKKFINIIDLLYLQVQNQVYKKHFDIYMKKQGFHTPRVLSSARKNKQSYTPSNSLGNQSKNRVVSHFGSNCGEICSQIAERPEIDQEISSRTVFGRYYTYTSRAEKVREGSWPEENEDDNYTVALYM